MSGSESGTQQGQAEDGSGDTAENATVASGERDEEPDVVGYEAEEDGVARIEAGEAETLPPMADGEVQGGGSSGDDERDEYISPIDFNQLWEQNEEIIAWLSVPGTNISYPVCEHREDDAYYLKHNSSGRWDINGALFTEAEYNLPDFSEPVTVVYGHNMKSGKMFGYLQETFRDGFDGRDEAIVYLPDEEIHYQLFAALPVGSGHLLAGRNLYNEVAFAGFVKDIQHSKSLEAVVDKSVKVEAGDQLLIMSTCVGGDADHRYIVVGKKV